MSGKKTVTRRFWDDNYAKGFRAGDIVTAYDRSPRYGGKPVAKIRITKAPYKQHLDKMSDEDEKKEGGLWGSAMGFVAEMSLYGSEPYVIEFEVIESGQGKLF